MSIIFEKYWTVLNLTEYIPGSCQRKLKNFQKVDKFDLEAGTAHNILYNNSTVYGKISGMRLQSVCKHESYMYLVENLM